MKQKIPQELIEKYILDRDWDPESNDESNLKPIIDIYPSIDDILNKSKEAFDDSIPHPQTNYIENLRYALSEIGEKGYVLSLPELIRAKCQSDKFNTIAHSAHSEITKGIDKNGLFGKKGDPVISIIHGGGLFTPDTLKKYNKKNEDHLSFDSNSFDKLLSGVTPNNKLIKLYEYNTYKNFEYVPQHRYGIILSKKDIKQISNDKPYCENPIHLALLGGQKDLNKFYRKFKTLNFSQIIFDEYVDLKNNKNIGSMLEIDSLNIIHITSSYKLKPGLFRYVKSEDIKKVQI